MKVNHLVLIWASLAIMGGTSTACNDSADDSPRSSDTGDGDGDGDAWAQGDGDGDGDVPIEPEPSCLDEEWLIAAGGAGGARGAGGKVCDLCSGPLLLDEDDDECPNTAPSGSCGSLRYFAVCRYRYEGSTCTKQFRCETNDFENYSWEEY